MDLRRLFGCVVSGLSPPSTPETESNSHDTAPSTQSLAKVLAAGRLHSVLRKSINYTKHLAIMPESDKPRTPTPRHLKPAPPRPGQVVHSPRLKSEVHFTLPGSIPVVGECSCARVDFIRPTEPFSNAEFLRNCPDPHRRRISAIPGPGSDATSVTSEHGH